MIESVFGGCGIYQGSGMSERRGWVDQTSAKVAHTPGNSEEEGLYTKPMEGLKMQSGRRKAVVQC